MERALRISAYRNIGFDGGKPKDERLVISNSLEKGELGDLLILIGPNNSGKSNVLDALTAFKDKRINKDRDVTDLFYDEKCQKPSISLSARTSDKKDEFAYKISLSSKDEIIYPNEKKVEKEPLYPSITVENFLPSLQQLVQYQNNNRSYSSWNYPDSFRTNNLSDLYDSISSSVSENNLEPLVSSVFSKMDEERNAWLNYYRSNLKQITNHLYNEYIAYVNKENSKSEPNLSTIINKNYKKKYGYDFLPNIIRYADKEISGKDFSSDYSNIKKSAFFLSLFNSIGFDISKINSAYDSFQKQSYNKGILASLEDEINEELKSIAGKFNKLYFAEDNKYSFRIDLESERIFFYVLRGGKSIGLDYQSTGFRWFFNLFFNLLNSTKLNPGDIIIMDEPATNLHVKGQRELRDFLKEFAIKNDVSVIIATHSPFLISLDNLDELRVIESKNNVSSIENNFAAVNMGDPDSLRAVKESLTVENYILMDPDKTVIFVEGITDYNYLTAFKQFFGKDDIYFLPINGVGKTNDESKSIAERILKIRKDPILLVDSDAAGKSMNNVLNNNLDIRILPLNKIVQNCNEIEDLFSKDDLERFDLKGKHCSTSSAFKHHMLKNKIDSEISEETKKNFETLFDGLLKEIE